MAASTGTSALALSGVAAANTDFDDGDTSHNRFNKSEASSPRGQPHGDEYEEGWIEFETGIETDVTIESNDTGQIIVQGHEPDPGERTFGGTFGVGGVTVTLEGTMGECVGSIEIGALGQSTTHTLTCWDTCQDNRFDIGAAYLDYEICYDWDTHELTYDVEHCIWHFTGWSCDHVEEESVLTS